MKTPPTKEQLRKKKTTMEEIMNAVLSTNGAQNLDPIGCVVSKDTIEFRLWNGERFVLTRLSNDD